MGPFYGQHVIVTHKYSGPKSKPSFLFGNKRKIDSCQYYWLMSVSQFRIELLYLSIRNGNMESVH